MRKLYLALAITMLVCLGCEWHLRSGAAGGEATKVSIERYDLIETLYLTTGDYAALGQLNTSYPRQTRMLIEDILQLGKVDDPNINQKFLHFFQDSTLQTLLNDVQERYADLDDISEELSEAFNRLKEELPEMEIPHVYTQVGSFDQSVVVDNHLLGISLDKYLGADYPFYLKNYTEQQRSMMVRQMIVPDCLGFYVLSLYPMPRDLALTQEGRNLYMGKIQWVVNHIMKRKIFKNEHVDATGRLMNAHQEMTIDQLLSSNNLK
jgi:hypothetical protein